MRIGSKRLVRLIPVLFVVLLGLSSLGLLPVGIGPQTIHAAAPTSDCSSTSPFGTGAAGSVTISTDTTVSASTDYSSLTIDSGVTLTIDSGVTVYVCGAFVNDGTVSGVGSAGAAGSTGAGSVGGTGPTLVFWLFSVDNAGSMTSAGGVGGPGGNGGKGGDGTAGSSSCSGLSGVGCVGAGGEGGKGGGAGAGANGGQGGSITVDYYTTTGSGLGTVTAPGGAGGAAGSPGAAGSAAAGSGASGTTSCTAYSGGAGSFGGSGGGATTGCGWTAASAGVSGATASAGSTGASGTVTESQVTSAQSFTVTPGNGAARPTIGISGCGVTNSTFTGDGQPHTYSGLSPSCVVTLSNPTGSSTAQYVFSGDGTNNAATESVTTASSGTGTAFSVTDYLQYSDTFKAQYTGTAPATGAPEHCAQAGAAATIGDLTTAGVSGYCDYGSVAYAQAFAPGGSSTQQYSAVPLTQGLVGSWLAGVSSSFVGDSCSGSLASVPDLSHNNDTGTCSGSPSYVAGPASGSAALNFSSAQTQAVDVPNSAIVSQSGDFTLLACFMPLSNHGGFFLLKNGYYGLEWQGTTGQMALYDNVYLYSAKTSWTLNTWYGLGMTKSGTTVSFYVNGVFDSSGTGASPTPTSNAFEIGGSAAASSYTDSRMTSVSLYDRAFTASEMAEDNPCASQQTMQYQITSSNTLTTHYYQQTPDSVSYSVSGGGTPTPPKITVTSLGQTLSNVITLTTSAQTLWLDSGSSWSVPHIESATSTQRWATNPSTGTASSTIAPTYYNQYDQPTKIDYIDGGTTSVSLTCTDYGANNATALTTSSQNFWADSGGTCSVPATTSIVNGASRLSMGPTYSYSVSKSGSVPSVLDGYLQYFLDDASGIGVSGQNNGTAYSPTGSAWFDHGTVTAAGLSTNSYALNAASWLYQVSPAGYQVLSNSSLSPVPSLSADTLSWTASGPVKWSLYDPSSSGYVVQTVNDNGVATSFSGPTSSGSGNVYTASGASPWTIDLAATGTAPNNSPGGGGYVPPSCPVGEFLNSTSGACQTPAAPTQIGNTAIPNTTVEEGVAVLLLVVIVALVASKEEKKTSDFVRREEKKVRFPRPKKR